MAWPNSRILDFISNSLPAISAAFLNALQDGIVDLFNGALSLKALLVDGVGGNPVTAMPGSITTTVNGSGAFVPTTVIPPGAMLREQVPYGWARCHWDPGAATLSLVRGVNVDSVSHPLGGYYTVNFSAGLTNPANACPWVMPFVIGADPMVLAPKINTVTDPGDGRCRVTFSIMDELRTFQDGDFVILLFGY